MLANAAPVTSPTPRHATHRTQRLHSQLRIIGVDDTSAATAWYEIVQRGWATGDYALPGTLYLTPQGARRIQSFTQSPNDAPTDGWYARALHYLYQ